jgi:hypothetical protein
VGNLIVSIEKLSCLISRGAIYERLYHPGSVPADVLDNLHDAMIKMYCAILQMMGQCYRIFHKSSALRVLHAIFNDDVVERLKECKELEVQVEREAHNCERTRSLEADAETQRLLGVLQELILRTDERVLSLLEMTGDRERLEILDWVSTVLYGSNHNAVTEARTPETCEWLLSHNSYLEWQGTSASIVLWLCGNRE